MNFLYRQSRSVVTSVYFSTLVWGFVGGSSLWAKPVTQSLGDGVKVEWGRARLSFSGVAKSTLPGEPSWEVLTQKALDEGVTFAKKTLESSLQTHSTLAGVKPEKLKTAVYERGRNYYSDGIQLDIEASLGRLIPVDSGRFQQKDLAQAPKGSVTGLILKLKGPTHPRATYRILDETGAVRFDLGQVASKAYEKNLMGRWFVNPSASELRSVVGARPVEMEATLDLSGDFVVSSVAWEDSLKEHPAVLTNALIAVSIPETGTF